MRRMIPQKLADSIKSFLKKTQDGEALVSRFETDDYLAFINSPALADVRVGDVIVADGTYYILLYKDATSLFTLGGADDGIYYFIYRRATIEDEFEFDENNSLVINWVTKLYKHELSFDSNGGSSTGTDMSTATLPLYLITTSPNPITLNYLVSDGLIIGNGLISGSNDDGYPITCILAEEDEEIITIRCNYASVTCFITYEDVTNFSDIVTEL